ncbi:MAG: ArnT family glycosyltransferase, partial [Anaerolineae bacterium]
MTPRWPAAGRGAVAVAVAVVLVAAFFRLRHLGYSEFQGDEARAMLLAARLLDSGDPGTLLWHKKGPLEVLVPAAVMAAGRDDEGAARLPFALAGLATVVGVMALAWRMWGAVAGLVAGGIVALDGYLVAFSRIVQYQSFVALAGVGAVILALRAFRRPGPLGRGDVADALGAGLILGVGSWGHYEMVFAAGPVAWLLAGRWAAAGGAKESWRWLLGLWGTAALAGAVVVAAFYVPFVRHPQFATTLRYIAGRRVGGGLLYDNLGDYFRRASFYNPSYLVLALGAAVGAVVAARLAEMGRGRRGRAMAAAWLALVAAVAMRPGAFVVAGPRGPMSLAVLVFAPALGALALWPGLDVEWRAMAVWFAGPFLAASFLVTKPHTHFYTMIPPGAILVAWGAARFAAGRRLRVAAATGDGAPHAGGLRRRGAPPWRRVALAAAAGAAVAVALPHQYVVYIRHHPEYKRVWPAARLPGYPTPFRELPRGGYFGFPYRAGWRVVRSWFATGVLSGSYDSNEEGLITGWYTGGAPRCGAGARYMIVAWRPQDEESLPYDVIAARYHLFGVVTVGGMEKLWVYDSHPVPNGPIMAAAEEAAGAEASPGVSQALGLPLPATGPQADFGTVARLLGVDRSLVPRPGGGLGVTLVWRAVGRPAVNYSVFLHLVDAGGNTVAQHDGWPSCGESPTSTWEPGTVVIDPHSVPLPAALAPGRYRLRLGLYDPATDARLPATGGPTTLTGDAVEAGWVEVRAP